MPIRYNGIIVMEQKEDDSMEFSRKIIEEYPLTLECRVKSRDAETGCLIGEIVASQADERILTDGKVDLGKLK